MVMAAVEPLRTMMSVSRQTGIPYLTCRYLVHAGRNPIDIRDRNATLVAPVLGASGDR
jgi:hypothetical protein